MLSGEGNAGERWKTTVCLISKKQLCTGSTLFFVVVFCTFLCRWFARLQRETSRNFLVKRFKEEMSYVFSFTSFYCRSFSPCISRRNNLELHLGCHTIWLSYFTLVCLWCGRTVEGGRCTVTWLPNFLGRIDFLSYGAPRAWSSANKSKTFWD